MYWGPDGGPVKEEIERYHILLYYKMRTNIRAHWSYQIIFLTTRRDQFHRTPKLWTKRKVQNRENTIWLCYRRRCVTPWLTRQVPIGMFISHSNTTVRSRSSSRREEPRIGLDRIVFGRRNRREVFWLCHTQALASRNKQLLQNGKGKIICVTLSFLDSASSGLAFIIRLKLTYTQGTCDPAPGNL